MKTLDGGTRRARPGMVAELVAMLVASSALGIIAVLSWQSAI